MMDKNTNTFDYGIDIIHLMPLLTSVGGVMVSIDAFQALDPGSIPGHRTFLFLKTIKCFSNRKITPRRGIEPRSPA